MAPSPERGLASFINTSPLFIFFDASFKYSRSRNMCCQARAPSPPSAPPTMPLVCLSAALSPRSATQSSERDSARGGWQVQAERSGSAARGAASSTACQANVVSFPESTAARLSVFKLSARPKPSAH